METLVAKACDMHHSMSSPLLVACCVQAKVLMKTVDNVSLGMGGAADTLLLSAKSGDPTLLAEQSKSIQTLADSLQEIAEDAVEGCVTAHTHTRTPCTHHTHAHTHTRTHTHTHHTTHHTHTHTYTHRCTDSHKAQLVKVSASNIKTLSTRLIDTARALAEGQEGSEEDQVNQENSELLRRDWSSQVSSSQQVSRG